MACKKLQTLGFTKLKKVIKRSTEPEYTSSKQSQRERQNCVSLCAKKLRFIKGRKRLASPTNMIQPMEEKVCTLSTLCTELADSNSTKPKQFPVCCRKKYINIRMGIISKYWKSSKKKFETYLLASHSNTIWFNRPKLLKNHLKLSNCCSLRQVSNKYGVTLNC